MKMDKSILIQKQVRDNSEDLRSYLKDLVIWEEEMKRKETEAGTYVPEVPIPRNQNNVKKIKKENKSKEKPSKIKSYDYAAWDKYDVDAECEKIDAEKSESEAEVEEEVSPEYKNRLRDEAVYEKERGNQFVKTKKWDEAIACYTHSIACDPNDPIFYANRALCFLKKNDLRSAEADCTSALILDPKYVKALQRRAVAHEGLKQYQEALDDLNLVLEIEPHNKESKKELDRLEKRLGIAKEENKPPVKTTSATKVLENKPSTPKDVQVKPVINETSKQEFSNEKLTVMKNEIAEKPIIKDNIKENLTVIKEDAKVPQKNFTKIVKQIPWPERQNSEIIIPIKKLPHLRSKKPLKRIEIIESEDNDIQIEKKDLKEIKSEVNKTEKENIEKTNKLNDFTLNYNDSNTLAQILAESNQVDIDDVMKEIENNTNDTESTMKSILTIPSTNKDAIKTVSNDDSIGNLDLPIPKSSVQFCTAWKMLKNDKMKKFVYLKNINPIEIPNIFQESLESDLFSDIIQILLEMFTVDQLPVFSFLRSLSNVKRFSTLTLFMSTQDKIDLRKLFEYCESKQAATNDEINKLRRKYEI